MAPVHLGGAVDDVLDVVRVTGAVDVGVVAVLGLVLDVGDGDGDAPLALLGSVVDGVEGAVLRPAPQAEVLGDGRGERRLAVVDVPDGAHVDVGLGTLELLLGHRGCLTTPVQGFASRLGLGMEPTLGFEPKTSSLPRKCSAAELCGPGGHRPDQRGGGQGGNRTPHSRRRLIPSAELTTCSTYPRTAPTLRDALPRGEENDLRSFLFSWSRQRDSNTGTGGLQNRCSTN